MEQFESVTDELNYWIAEHGNERDALNVALTRLHIANDELQQRSATSAASGAGAAVIEAARLFLNSRMGDRNHAPEEQALFVAYETMYNSEHANAYAIDAANAQAVQHD